MLKTTLMAFGLLVPCAMSDAATTFTSPTPAPRTALADDVKVETVTITASDRTEIKADYWPAKGDERAPAALLIHEAGSDRKSMTELAERLSKSGFAVLVPDLRGHGESIARPEDAYAKLEDKEAKAKAWAFATRDIDAASRWLRAQKTIHSANLNLFGTGAGCALAVRHGAGDENTRSLTLIAPEAEMLGFRVAEDLLDLDGVQTFVIASKEGKKDAEALADGVHKTLGSKPFITVEVLKAKENKELMDDRRLISTITKPLKEIAFPQRGGR